MKNTKNKNVITKELTIEPINSPKSCSEGFTLILYPDLKSFRISPERPHATAIMQASKNSVRVFKFVENFIPPMFNPFNILFKNEIIRIVIMA